MEGTDAMRELSTRRLRLIPLSLEELQLLLEDRRRLERHLGLEVSNERLSDEMKDVVEKEFLAGVLADPEHYVWHTEWQIVLKEENRIIGGLCLKGGPDENGEVEIGYGMQPSYRRKGYMTEAVGAAIDWALSQPGVTAVTAETARTNAASIRVLEKASMVPVTERNTEMFLWWRRSRCDGEPRDA